MRSRTHWLFAVALLANTLSACSRHNHYSVIKPTPPRPSSPPSYPTTAVNRHPAANIEASDRGTTIHIVGGTQNDLSLGEPADGSGGIRWSGVTTGVPQILPESMTGTPGSVVTELKKDPPPRASKDTQARSPVFAVAPPAPPSNLSAVAH
jgi:hypothetical protein